MEGLQFLRTQNLISSTKHVMNLLVKKNKLGTKIRGAPPEAPPPPHSYVTDSETCINDRARVIFSGFL